MKLRQLLALGLIGATLMVSAGSAMADEHNRLVPLNTALSSTTISGYGSAETQATTLRTSRGYFVWLWNLMRWMWVK